MEARVVVPKPIPFCCHCAISDPVRHDDGAVWCVTCGGYLGTPGRDADEGKYADAPLCDMEQPCVGDGRGGFIGKTLTHKTRVPVEPSLPIDAKEDKSSDGQVLIYSPSMRVKSEPIEKFDDDLRALVKLMFARCDLMTGLGLAASQVGLGMRMAVINTPGFRQVIINPELLETSGEQVGTEGCLSLPGYRAKVKRAQRIVLKYFDEQGEEHKLEAEGLLARAIQHEVDHMNGEFYIDRLSLMQRNLILDKHRKRIKRWERDQLKSIRKRAERS